MEIFLRFELLLGNISYKAFNDALIPYFKLLFTEYRYQESELQFNKEPKLTYSKRFYKPKDSISLRSTNGRNVDFIPRSGISK